MVATHIKHAVQSKTAQKLAGCIDRHCLEGSEDSEAVKSLRDQSADQSLGAKKVRLKKVFAIAAQ